MRSSSTRPAQASLPGTGLARGSEIGRFVVLGLLGKGTMGEVYAAYDPTLDRNVAIKLLQGNRDSDSAAGRLRLMREAQAIARVSHPNVVVVYDTGTFRDRVFIAMELVQGNTMGYWLCARARTWPEVLEVFTAAGRGLAAAHERELVHRDFKPDNVMIGADGQVRVMDFGLVQWASASPKVVATNEGAITRRPIAPEPPPRVEIQRDDDLMATRLAGSAPAPIRSSSVHALDVLGVDLTQTGTSMGTPAYMSPEQLRGDATDARADQFSFCVALYEGLYGQRPFAGRNIADLTKNVAQGKVREAPAGIQVPSWLREVVVRGLEANPDDRWPSMSALLAELEKQPAVASRRRFVSAAAAKLAGIWEAPRGDKPTETSTKAEIQHAFLATGKVYAAKAFEGASQNLDRYTRRWSELYVEACEATHVRGEQSAEVLDLRMACLQEGLEDLKALCRLFQRATPEVVENAVSATNALGGLDRCEDIQLLRAVVKPPQGTATRELVDRLRADLADVRALYRVGRFNDGLLAVTPVERAARTLQYDPLLADVLITMGTLYNDKGVADEASRVLEEGLWCALLSGHDEAAAEAAVLLVYSAGCVQARFESAEIWSRMAETLLRRMGGHDLLWGWLLHNRAALRDSQGRLTEALEAARQALAAKQKALDPNHADLGFTIGNIALYLQGLGDFAQAVEQGGRAVQIVAAGMGPDHPRTALVLSNQSEFLARVGRFDEATDAAARALAIFERETDPDGLYVTYPLTALGISHLGAGRVAAALPILERSNRIRDASESVAAKRAEVRFALARALWEAGQDRARAVALASQARDEYLQSPLPPGSRDLDDVVAWLDSRESASPPAETETRGDQ